MTTHAGRRAVETVRWETVGNVCREGEREAHAVIIGSGEDPGTHGRILQKQFALAVNVMTRRLPGRNRVNGNLASIGGPRTAKGTRRITCACGTCQLRWGHLRLDSHSACRCLKLPGVACTLYSSSLFTGGCRAGNNRQQQPRGSSRPRLFITNSQSMRPESAANQIYIPHRQNKLSSHVSHRTRDYKTSSFKLIREDKEKTHGEREKRDNLPSPSNVPRRPECHPPSSAIFAKGYCALWLKRVYSTKKENTCKE